MISTAASPLFRKIGMWLCCSSSNAQPTEAEYRFEEGSFNMGDFAPHNVCRQGRRRSTRDVIAGGDGSKSNERRAKNIDAATNRTKSSVQDQHGTTPGTTPRINGTSPSAEQDDAEDLTSSLSAASSYSSTAEKQRLKEQRRAAFKQEIKQLLRVARSSPGIRNISAICTGIATPTPVSFHLLDDSYWKMMLRFVNEDQEAIFDTERIEVTLSLGEYTSTYYKNPIHAILPHTTLVNRFNAVTRSNAICAGLDFKNGDYFVLFCHDRRSADGLLQLFCVLKFFKDSAKRLNDPPVTLPVRFRSMTGSSKLRKIGDPNSNEASWKRRNLIILSKKQLRRELKGYFKRKSEALRKKTVKMQFEDVDGSNSSSGKASFDSSDIFSSLDGTSDGLPVSKKRRDHQKCYPTQKFSACPTGVEYNSTDSGSLDLTSDTSADFPHSSVSPLRHEAPPSQALSMGICSNDSPQIVESQKQDILVDARPATMEEQAAYPRCLCEETVNQGADPAAKEPSGFPQTVSGQRRVSVRFRFRKSPEKNNL